MKHVSSLLKGTGLVRNEPIDLLEQIWSRAAPDYLQQVCNVRRYHDGCLVLQVHSPIWVSRIRQQERSLLRQLRQSRDFAGLETIKLEVVPRQVTSKRRRRTPRHLPLSRQARSSLQASASQVSDPELREVLLRLAGQNHED
jgi:hypothetical protein